MRYKGKTITIDLSTNPVSLPEDYDTLIVEDDTEDFIGTVIEAVRLKEESDMGIVLVGCKDLSSLQSLQNNLEILKVKRYYLGVGGIDYLEEQVSNSMKLEFFKWTEE